MKKIVKKLILYFALFVIVKTLISYFIQSPSAFSDEYIYSKIARSFFYSQTISIHQQPTEHLPLYPVILSLAYLSKNMKVIFLLMKFINAILSSLIIFPSWLLAKEFLSEKKALGISILISLLPMNFAFSSFILTENLFYPLFLFSIYFIYKTIKNTSYKYDILTGFFIGLSYLTKVTGIILIPVTLIIFLVKIIKKDYRFIKKGIVILITFLTIIILWLLRNNKLFGFKLTNLLGYYSRETVFLIKPEYSFLALLTRFTYHIGLILLGTGIIFTLYMLKNLKEKDESLKYFTVISLSSILLFVLAASHHCNHCTNDLTQSFFWLTSRPFERYLNAVFPIIIILGTIGLERNKRLSLKLVVPASLVLIFSSILTLFPLFPPNNISLTWLGILKYVMDFLFYKRVVFESLTTFSLIFFSIFLGSLPIILFYLVKNINKNKVITYFGAFFLLISLLSLSATYYNSSTYWYKGEQMQLGLWFNDVAKEKNVLFDERDCDGKLTKLSQEFICAPKFTIIGFWLNDDIVIGNVDNLKGIDYIITKHKMDLELIKETNSGIKIYSAS